MKAYISYIFLMVSLSSFGQQDYILTVGQDTLYGDVLSRSTSLIIYNEAGKQKFYLSEVREYTIKGGKYMVIADKRRNGKIRYYQSWIAEDGHTRLLLLRGGLGGQTYYTYHNGIFTLVYLATFSDEVWPILMQCPTFAEKYIEYGIRNQGRKTLFPVSDAPKWREMIKFYNQQCPLSNTEKI